MKTHSKNSIRIRLICFDASSVLLAWMLLVSPAGAQGASTVVGGLRSLATEKSVELTAQICSSRYPETALSWTTTLASFRQKNAPALAELRGLAEKLDADSKTALLTFEQMVALNFEMATGEQALDMCNQSLGGLLTASLESRLVQARKLLSLGK